jgi:hypothetical protein
LTKQEPIEIMMLAKQAQVSEDKEVYVQLEKTRSFRIGMGSRAQPPMLSFFIEVIINLSTENMEVNLQRLENIFSCLKTLKAREYTLCFEDNNCISCEKAIEQQNLDEEYRSVKTLMQKVHLSK